MTTPTQEAIRKLAAGEALPTRSDAVKHARILSGMTPYEIDSLERQDLILVELRKIADLLECQAISGTPLRIE